MKSLPKVCIYSEHNKQVVAQECVYAKTILSRLVGLLNHKELKTGEAMLIEPCNQVHTLFMSFGIDAIFLNRDNTIVGIAELPPWKISKLHFKARKVLEVPLGTSKKLNLQMGETLQVTPC